MPFVHCPHCHQEFTVDAAFLGHTVTCLHCRQNLVVGAFVREPPPPPRPRYRVKATGPSGHVGLLIAVGVITCLLVATAAGVYLYERASLRADRMRLEGIRTDYITAVSKRQSREMELDLRSPPKVLELEYERRARYEKDAKWQELDRRVSSIESEANRIIDRWPELRR